MRQKTSAIDSLVYVHLTGDRATPNQITIKSIHDIPILPQLLRRYCIKAEPKRCYDNATEVAVKIPDAQYVEGEVWIPVAKTSVFHAWNVYNGQHFDLTWELFQGLQPSFQYYAILNDSLTNLMVQGYDPNHTGCLMTQHINLQLQRSPYYEDKRFQNFFG